MKANPDGTLRDDGTITADVRLTKTELKAGMTATDPNTGKAVASQLASFGNISIYRIAENDILLHCVFEDGLTKYCYILPQKIETEEIW